MPPGKASMMKKMSALVRDPSVIGMGSNNNRQNPQASKPESLLQQQQREQQQQPQRAPSRQAIADAAKANFVKGGGRFGSHPTSGIPLPPKRNNTAPELPQEKRNGGALWEESTVGSILDDSQGSEGRGRGDANPSSNPFTTRNSYPDPPDPPLSTAGHAYFTLKDGRFTLADDRQRANLASGVQSTLGKNTYESPRTAPAAIQYSHHLSDGNETKQAQPRPLTRARLPLRERDTKRTSYVERAGQSGYPPAPSYDPMGITSSKPAIQSATVPYDDAATKALTNPRSTVFQLSSDDGMAEADDGEAEEEDQRTPRPNRYQRSPSPTKSAQPHNQPRDGQSYGLQESAFPRNTHAIPPTRERDRPKKRKNVDLDYDEAALKRMNYTDLRNEAFDFDPAIGNSPTRSSRNSTALGDRLSHYKSKDPKAQGDFFKTLAVDEWEDAGDWFLEQFGGLINQLKDARKNKRAVCKEFEAEIERRHVAVESKMEVIVHTLRRMKSEGEVMMKDREID
ncbi:hypothetical protein MKZ38_000364 [Zalerion maritima]|uniref:Extracellular mutant protein 11 C-terminal domain-containing protein n=1 Tax=Zalerion maritima TaxID=339359 RepID=A0AAD5RRM0_9PEZI|nr:hypothetical protein MKZ38_000364 [Zalerion maritima]